MVFTLLLKQLDTTFSESKRLPTVTSANDTIYNTTDYFKPY